MRIIIIGGGPCGLGAAFRCEELIKALGHSNLEWTVLEQSPQAGGLASSIVDDQGFTWDIGGHVIFSHYSYFSRLLDNLLPEKEWNHKLRESWVWMRNTFIPYPLQLNIHHLPTEEALKCVEGFLHNERNRTNITAPRNFHEWLLQNFGQGLCETFMFPYNRKVWAFQANEMNAEWVGERVATVDTLKVVKNLLKKQDDMGWGPNSTFRFPLHGGTGAIWTALYNSLPKDKFRFNSEVTKIDGHEKVIHLSSGETLPYDALISTMPMDKLCLLIEGCPSLSHQELVAKASLFKHSSTHVVGFGLAGSPPPHLSTKCWLYFPEDDCPFYRSTVFSNYSPYVVPKPGEQWSIMCEVAESTEKPVDMENIISIAEKGLYNTKLISEQDVIVQRFHVRLEYGYPTPFCGRDFLFDELNTEFEKLAVLSRGRFGSWKYEVSNQDHSLMLGVEAVDHILFGTEEMTLKYPNIVNSKTDKTGRVPHCKATMNV